jgi:ubiquinone/menaquinone biosynthesis C-methylase UbiE
MRHFYHHFSIKFCFNFLLNNKKMLLTGALSGGLVLVSCYLCIMKELKAHWNNIYRMKSSTEVSWTQQVPVTSLDFIHSFQLRKDAAIIDVGGGESRFVDHLLAEGFTNITVLDISEEGLEKTKSRLGKDNASKIKWIVSDVTEFTPLNKFDVWHDRATFHFLTTPEQIKQYVDLASRAVNDNGFMAIGTFSDNGPTTCSGLQIKQYSESQLERTLTYYFQKIRCITEDHITPFNTVQNFLFCSFRKAA